MTAVLTALILISLDFDKLKLVTEVYAKLVPVLEKLALVVLYVDIYKGIDVFALD